MGVRGAAGARRVSALALLLGVVLLGPALLAAPAFAADAVRLSASPSPATAGSPVRLTATVTPKVKGRPVTFAVKAGGAWHVLGKTRTDKRGTASLATTFATAGKRTLQATAAAYKGVAKRTDTATLSVRAPPALQVEHPVMVTTGSLFEVDLAVTPATDLTDASLALTAPSAGAQVTPPDELVVGDDGTGTVDLGALPAATTRTVRVQWQAPSLPGSLTFTADLTDPGGLADHVEAPVQVVAAPGGGMTFDAALQGFRTSRDAPRGTGALPFTTCGYVPPGQPAVPSYADAKAAAEAWVAANIDSQYADEWDNLAAQQDAGLTDDLAMMALADRRPGAALAASLRGQELTRAAGHADPTSLDNAAVAANLLGHPEWAVAFLTRAATEGTGVGIGAPQEAVRLTTLGHSWVMLGDRAKAESLLRRAVLLAPDNAQINQELATVLGCEQKKGEELPYAQAGVRFDTTPDEIVEGEGTYATSRRSAERDFDLSQGLPSSLRLPVMPASWNELIGMSRDGDGYYYDEDQRIQSLQNQLTTRQNDLWSLVVNDPNQTPATNRRVLDVLSRVGSPSTPTLQDLADQMEVAQTAMWGVMKCPSDDSLHSPFCYVDGQDTSCGTSQQVFDEWDASVFTYRQALGAYVDAAWPVWTGLQAGVSDPDAAELVGVTAKLAVVQHLAALTYDLHWSAENLTHLNQVPDPDCVNPQVPVEPPTPSQPYDPDVDPQLCASGSIASRVTVQIDFGVGTIGTTCEKVSLELTAGGSFLKAFARVELPYDTTAGVTFYVGSRGQAGDGTFDSAVYLETDGKGGVKDIGGEAGPSYNPTTGEGFQVSVNAFDDKVRFSAMSTFE